MKDRKQLLMALQDIRVRKVANADDDELKVIEEIIVLRLAEIDTLLDEKFDA